MSNHATRLTYSAFDLKIWSIFHQSQIRKTAYASRASDGFPRVLLLSAQCAAKDQRFRRPQNYNKFEIRGQTSFPYFIVILLRPVASAIPRPPLSKNNARSIPSRAEACQIDEGKFSASQSRLRGWTCACTSGPRLRRRNSPACQRDLL